MVVFQSACSFVGPQREYSMVSPQGGHMCKIEAYSGRRKVGEAKYITADNKVCEILNIKVTPDHDNDGTAKKLYGEAERQMRNRGCMLAIVGTNKRHLYSRAGFVDRGKMPIYNGEPLEDMPDEWRQMSKDLV